MNALKLTEWISPAEYLAHELRAEVKHEYIGGTIHAVSGARIRHNRIGVSLLRSLANQLAGHPCETFNSDMKVRIQLPTQVRFYYHDAMLVCQSNPESDSFQDQPRVVIEVLSDTTRRLDLVSEYPEPFRLHTGRARGTSGAGVSAQRPGLCAGNLCRPAIERSSTRARGSLETGRSVRTRNLRPGS